VEVGDRFQFSGPALTQEDTVDGSFGMELVNVSLTVT
jgi:hypothetical protein